MNEEIKEYDENNNRIYFKTSTGHEIWQKYDENNREIYYKYNEDFEFWYKWENNEQIKIIKREFENIKIKEYNSRTKCSRFEIIDI